MFRKILNEYSDDAKMIGHRILIKGDRENVSKFVSNSIAELGLVLHKFEPAQGELERVFSGKE